MIKFGTGGWRAVIADEFTKENIRLLMAGLCRLMEKEGLSGAEICVGYDRRFLSKESAHWAAEVLVGYGFHPFVINRSSPTPLMMFTVKKRQEPYGIAVTASHNPAIYNGIKVFTAGGRDADQTVTARIEAEIAKLTPNDVRSVDYDEALEKGFITEANPMNEYLDSILAAVDVDAIKKAALRIGFDPMYGVSWSSLSMLLTTCRCDLEVIHDRHDTLFGGKLPAPNVDTLKPLAALVLAGSIPGAFLLKHVDARAVKVLFGVVVAALGAEMFSREYSKKRLRSSKIVLAIIGVTAGVLCGLFGVGALLAAYVSRVTEDGGSFKANISAVFIVDNTFRIVLYSALGLLTFDTLKTALLLLPFALAGLFLGMKCSSRMNESLVKKITSILLVLSGISLILKNL